MLKQTIAYTDFNDRPIEETLYFNLSKTELADNLELEQKFRELMVTFSGEVRPLTIEEVRMLLDLVKDLMRMSYGERSLDGRHFKKSEEIWQNFTWSAAYDAFLFSLFENPEKAIAFLIGVFPQDLINEVRSNQPDLFKEIETVEGPVTTEEEANLPAWILENRDPTHQELLSMSTEQLREAFARKTSTRA